MSTPLKELKHNISLEQAIRMTNTFRQQKTELEREFIGRINLPISETFNREAFEQLLAQPGCAGIRMYLSMDDSLQVRAIFVGVNENEEDLLPAEAAATEGVIIEAGKLCPPDCGTASLLNS